MIKKENLLIQLAQEFVNQNVKPEALIPYSEEHHASQGITKEDYIPITYLAKRMQRSDLRHLEEADVLKYFAHYKREQNPIDASTFLNVEINDSIGPLTLAQKIYIRDNLSDTNAEALAVHVNTNAQNVRLAQAGKFHVPKKTTQQTERPYGPLTVEEKIYIRDNEAGEPTSYLASKYNTAYINVQRAQTGQFATPQAPQQHSHSRPFGPLTIEEKRDIRDNRQDEPTSQLALEYNTHTSNIHVAKKGMFTDTTQAVTLQYKYNKLIEILEEHDMLHTIEGLW